jgi:hypothetical protein
LRQQVTILNSETILALEPDISGLAWLDANLPDGARVAVNSWRWLGNTWAAGDGGAWLVPLTGFASTTPPADYTYDATLLAQVEAFNQGATGIEEWSDPVVAQWLAGQGVSHLFVGARGGFLDPSELARNPALELLYSQDGVFVFGLKTGASS